MEKKKKKNKKKKRFSKHILCAVDKWHDSKSHPINDKPHAKTCCSIVIYLLFFLPSAVGCFYACFVGSGFDSWKTVELNGIQAVRANDCETFTNTKRF